MAELLQASALSSLPRGVSGGGVSIMERRGLALATVQARRGQEQALRAQIAQSFAVDLPGRPAFASGRDIAFVGIGPQSWLAIAETGAPAFPSSLRSLVGGTASVSDQSGGYAILRVSGPRIRDVLAKGFPIDLEPRVFRNGDAATTIVSHIGATIWRREDAPDGSACFDISLFRSLAESFQHWFCASGAEFGVTWPESPARP